MSLIAIIIALLVIAFLGYRAWKGRLEAISKKQPGEEKALPRMANLPPKETPLTIRPPKPSYPPDAPLLEQVRKALREGIDPAGAVAMAKGLPESPEKADAAFLLFDYAADSGNAEAALAVGRFYDPSDNGPSGTIRKDPGTAYAWYRKALTEGEEKAGDRLVGLRRWLEEQAVKGSGEAKSLLEGWD